MNPQVSLSQAKRAVRLFSHEGVDKSTVLHNVKAYLAALNYMGDRYILAKPIVLKRVAQDVKRYL